MLQLVLLVVAAGGIGIVVALATMWSGPFSPFLVLEKSEIYRAPFGVGFFALVILAVVRGAERDGSNDPRSRPQLPLGALGSVSLALVRRCGWSLVLVALMACADQQDGRGGSVRSSTTAEAQSIELVATAPGLAEQCTLAANVLGFAVPCPTSLPAVGGLGAECKEKQPWAPELPRCVSQAGGDETLDTIFFLSVDDYDGPGSVRHLVVEARRLDRAPSAPCFDGQAQGELRAGSRTLAVLACGERTAEAATQVRHGEGAHYGHLLGYWDEAGIRYVVSIHGHADANRELIRAVTEAIRLVRP